MQIPKILKTILALTVGVLVPHIEWAGADFLNQLASEFSAFIQNPDIVGGITGALTRTEMPISLSVQYGGTGLYALKKVTGKGLSENQSKNAGLIGLGSMISRTAMYGSHNSPALPPKDAPMSVDVANSIYV